MSTRCFDSHVVLKLVMQSRLSPSGSSRRLVERFAAHLAHLLGGDSEVAVIKPFAIYRRILSALSGGTSEREEGAPNRTAYRDHVAGFALVAAGRSPEEVAQRYFEAVLERPLSLARNNDVHIAHLFFLALCRRGLHPLWMTANLGRSADAIVAGGEKAQPSDFAEVAGRLARLPSSISAGNPAVMTREKKGPLALRAGAGQAGVAEEMSVWGAIQCCPTQLSTLAKGEQFNQFCSTVIKAIETANAPYGALLALGLSPFDWGDMITTNTAKKLGAFLAVARAQCGGDPPLWQNLAVWRQVWTQRQVPGFSSAEDLWESSLGRALRLPQVARRIDLDSIEEIESIDHLVDAEPVMLDEAGFLERVALARAQGEIDDFEAWLLGEIFKGEVYADLAGAKPVRERCPGGVKELAAFVDELTTRLIDWSERLDGQENGDASR